MDKSTKPDLQQRKEVSVEESPKPFILLVNPFDKIPGEQFRDQRYTFIYKRLKDSADVIWISSDFHHWSHKKRLNEDLPDEDRNRIKLVPTPSYTKNVSVGRMLSYAVLSYRAYREIVRLSHKPDLILFVGPVELMYLVARHARKNKIPAVVDVLDTWPDLFVMAFPRKIRLLGRLLLAPWFWMASRAFQMASHVTAVSQTYTDWAMQRAGRVDSENASFYYLGSTGSVEATVKKHSVLRCFFAGQFGFNYDLETVIEAARKLQNAGCPVHFLLAGDGYKRESLQRSASDLQNVELLGWVPYDRLTEIAKTCHVGLSCYTATATQSVPTKIFDYLSAGLYIVNSLAGETTKLLTKHGIGVSYLAESKDGLAEVITELASNIDAVAQAGLRAAEICQAEFTCESIYARMSNRLLMLAKHKLNTTHSQAA